MVNQFKALALFCQRKWRGLDSAYANEAYSAFKTVLEAGYKLPAYSSNSSGNPFSIGQKLTVETLTPWVISLAKIIQEEEKAKRPPSLMKRLTSRLTRTKDRQP